MVVFLAPEEVHPFQKKKEKRRRRGSSNGDTAWEICTLPPYEVQRMVTHHDSFILIIDVTQQNLFCLLKIRYN